MPQTRMPHGHAKIDVMSTSVRLCLCAEFIDRLDAELIDRIRYETSTLIRSVESRVQVHSDYEQA